ncbi:CMRF35-like molecule 1 [Neolamprologus brichardi]|uniref:CMRF35-like molecule 1 n=1 Tax=Neolamprologus brichardi TaxID=32507 RepID=UPI00164386A5|nr:CMRF35-like molecule 1 [Neolamprologus brichardi]
MAASLQIIRLITAAVSFLSVMGNMDRRVNINCYNKPVNQTTFLGASATINCNYTRVKESGIKSFCRENASSYCNNLISSYDSNYTRLDRFSLRDDKQQRVYTVIISALTQQDAGKYQCSIKSDTSTSCLTEIHLYILNWDDIKPHEMVGVTSETATITCNYSKSEEDTEKYLCKGQNPLNCDELIRTTEEDRVVVKDRFHIRGNKRRNYFYVYISDLRRTDSGTYWCGSGKTMTNAEYTKIYLSITERHTQTKKSVSLRIKRDGNSKDENLGLHIGIGVGVGSLVVIAVVVLILYRCKVLRMSETAAEGSSELRTKSGHNTEGNTGDHQYEEINIRRQQESSLPSVCAVTSPPPDLVYLANLNFQKDTNVNLPADIVHYATVDFQKDERMLPVTSENGSTPMGQDVINPSADILQYTTVGFHTAGKTLPDNKKNSSAGRGHSATRNQEPETTLYSTVIRQ